MQGKAERNKAMQSNAEHLHLALHLALPFVVRQRPYRGRAGFIFHFCLLPPQEGGGRSDGHMEGWRDGCLAVPLAVRGRPNEIITALGGFSCVMQQTRLLCDTTDMSAV